ncbi:MAG TPA: extracellular solute-binding protein [bacterium]|nr:extracellular solute-binding protein [bacterium]HQB76677.1 extracellular solute-binding protein [bacterium]
MFKKIISLFLLAIFILTSGFGCKTVDKQTQTAMQPITLTYWRVFDDSDAFQEIIDKYKAIHPNITINYRKLRYEEYELELLNALAEDRGPDILSLHNTWLRKYQNKLTPMPASITMAYPIEQGTVKKEVVPVLKTVKSLSLNDLKNTFIDVVYDDVVLDDNQIYGLPLSVDTLVLYYNRDLLNNAGITQAPKYWNKEFQQNVKKLTKQDPVQGITQAGIGLGGSTNIERYSDILSVLMMQNGATMMDGKQVLFNTIPPAAQDTKYNPGLEALRFYIDFSNPGKEVYSWNSDLPNSLNLFISGKLAMMFGYSYHAATIKAQAPKLNFSISALPQIEGSPIEVNFANYWVESVSKKSKYPNEAWDFIQFATKEEQVKSYLTKTKKPTALRSLIASQREDNDLSVFASELLTAKSWYRGKDANAAEVAIGEMIDNARQNPNKILDAINTGAAKVQQTVN